MTPVIKSETTNTFHYMNGITNELSQSKFGTRAQLTSEERAQLIRWHHLTKLCKASVTLRLLMIEDTDADTTEEDEV